MNITFDFIASVVGFSGSALLLINFLFLAFLGYKQRNKKKANNA